MWPFFPAYHSRIAKKTYLVVQMLHEWIGERLKQLSSFLAIILLGPSKNLVHILLQYVHSSMEKLMLFHVVSSLVWKNGKRNDSSPWSWLWTAAKQHRDYPANACSSSGFTRGAFLQIESMARMKTLWIRVMSSDKYPAKSSETTVKNGALGREMRGYVWVFTIRDRVVNWGLDLRSRVILL